MHETIQQVIEDFKRTARKCEWVANMFLIAAFLITIGGAVFYANLTGSKEEFDPTWRPDVLKSFVECKKVMVASEVARKVGIGVLVLFLVQVMVRSYRYNKRIGNFYNSRAQTLEYIELKKSGFPTEMLKFFTTDEIEIGMSGTPYQSITKVFK